MVSSIYTGNSHSGDLEVIGLGNGTVSLVNWCGQDGWHGSDALPSPRDYSNPSFTRVRIGNYRETLEVIGLGADNCLYVVCYLDKEGWKPGSRIGSFGGSSITSLCIGNSSHGDMQIVALKDGRVHLLNWLGNDGWNRDVSLPAPAGNPTFDRMALGFHNNVLEVIGLTSGNQLYVASYLAKNEGWKPGSRLGDPPNGTITSLITGTTHSGDLQVIGLVDGKPYILAWIGDNSGWQGPSRLPMPRGYDGTFTQLAINRYRDDLEIVGVGSDNNVYIVCYIGSKDGWQPGRLAPPVSKDGAVTSLVTGNTHSGDLQVIGLVGDSPYLLTWLGGQGWQSGGTLVVSAIQTLFRNLPTSGDKVTKFKHDDPQAAAHIQGMSLWQDYTVFSHNKTDAYGYLLFGDQNGNVQTIEVAINGEGGNGSDKKYYHPSGLQAFENYLVLGVEPSESNNNDGQVVFYRMASDSGQVTVTLLDRPSFQRLGRGAACCGLTKTSGTYFLSVYSTKSQTVDIYASQADSIENASFGDMKFSITPNRGYDNLSMASTQDGAVYLFGLRSENEDSTFADYVDLYEINVRGGVSTLLQSRKFKCESVGGEIGVHFRYGAGVTVTGSAQGDSLNMQMYASARHFELTGTPLNFFGSRNSGDPQTDALFRILPGMPGFLAARRRPGRTG